MRAALLMFIMMILIPLGFFSPFVGLLGFTWVAYFRPHEWAYVQSTQYSLAIAVTTLVGYLCFELPRRSPRLGHNVLILLLWVQLSLSTLLAQSSQAAMPKYIEFSKILFIALLTTALLISEKRIWWMLTVTLGSIGLIICRSIISIIITRGQAKVYGSGGATEDNNDFAILLALTIPIMFYFAKAQTNKWLKAGFYLLTMMTVVTDLFTYSRGGLLGLVAGCLFLLAKAKHKIISFVAVGILTLSFMAVMPHSMMERFGSIKTAREKDTSAQQRLRMWNTSLQIIRDHPFIGVGIRNILVVQGQYTDPYERLGLVAHNAYLQIATDAGVPALLLLLALIGLSWWRLWRTRRILLLYDPDSPLIKYAHGCEAGLAGYMVSAFFASRQDLELLYTVIALSTSMILIARNIRKEADANRLRPHNAIVPVREATPELDAA